MSGFTSELIQFDTARYPLIIKHDLHLFEGELILTRIEDVTDPRITSWCFKYDFVDRDTVHIKPRSDIVFERKDKGKFHFEKYNRTTGPEFVNHCNDNLKHTLNLPKDKIADCTHCGAPAQRGICAYCGGYII